MPLDWLGELRMLQRPAEVEALAAELERRFDGAEVSFRDRDLLIYADSEARVREIASEAMRVALVAEGLVVKRWSAARSAWQDPGLPLGEPPPESREPDLDRARWEVLVTCPGRRAERDLGERLRAEGLPVSQGFWETRILVPSNRRIAIPFAHQADAEGLAERLRTEAPIGSKIRVRRLSFFRRWLLAQEFYGGHGDGGGGYGDGGGGDG